MRTAENNNPKKETPGKLSPILITQQDAFKGVKKRSFRILLQLFFTPNPEYNRAWCKRRC